MRKNKMTFTLAEVLIVIGVVGVVAALTIPTLFANIQEKVRKKQITVFEQKLKQGTDLLNIQNGIGPYYNSTMDFVNALSNHMKILAVCNKDNFSLCIPYSTVVRTNGEIKNVAQYFSDDGMGVGQFKNYGEVVSLITGDGHIMVLSWRKDCPIADSDSPSQDTTSCISGWFDLNGKKGPNTWGKDIISYNYGYSKAFRPTPISQAECESLKTKLGINYCPCTDPDYWAGAVKQCGGVDNMITKKELDNIKDLIMEEDNSGNLQHTENAQTIRNQLFGTTDRVGIWEKEGGNSCGSAYKYFISHLRETAKTNYVPYDGWRSSSAQALGTLMGMCKGGD